jgi:hypothetical protein
MEFLSFSRQILVLYHEINLDFIFPNAYLIVIHDLCFFVFLFGAVELLL